MVYVRPTPSASHAALWLCFFITNFFFVNVNILKISCLCFDKLSVILNTVIVYFSCNINVCYWWFIYIWCFKYNQWLWSIKVIDYLDLIYKFVFAIIDYIIACHYDFISKIVECICNFCYFACFINMHRFVKRMFRIWFVVHNFLLL